MTLRRLGRANEAEKLLEPISIDLDVVDSVPYHKLLLMFEGEIAPEDRKAGPAEVMRGHDDADDGQEVKALRPTAAQLDPEIK